MSCVIELVPMADGKICREYAMSVGPFPTQELALEWLFRNGFSSPEDGGLERVHNSPRDLKWQGIVPLPINTSKIRDIVHEVVPPEKVFR